MIELFNLFKGKNGKNVDVAVGNFLQEEKKRHKRAVDFLQLMAGVTAHVAAEVWGMADQDVQVSDTVRFDLATQSFFFKGAESDINVQALKGQPSGRVFSRLCISGKSYWMTLRKKRQKTNCLKHF